MSRLSGLGFAAFALLAVAGCGSQGTKGIANVNGDVITDTALRGYMPLKQTVRVNDGNGQPVDAVVAQRLDFQVLQDVLQRQIVMQLAKDEGVYPGDADVLKELEFRKARNPQYIKQMQTAGINLDTIKEMIIYELSEERLTTKGVTVTMEETEKYIKDNPLQFTDPAAADLLFILVRSESRKPAVDRALASGQSFAQVAIQFSEDPNVRQSGGRFQERVIDRLATPIRNAVSRTAMGKSTEWLQFSDGWVKFYVERKEPAKKRTLTKEDKIQVQRALAVQRGRQAKDLTKMVIDKLASSTIVINEPGLAEMWKAYIEQVKQRASAMRAPNAGVPTPPGGGTAGTAGTSGGAPSPGGTTGN